MIVFYMNFLNEVEYASNFMYYTCDFGSLFKILLEFFTFVNYKFFLNYIHVIMIERQSA